MDERANLIDAVDHAIRQRELTPHQRAAIIALDQGLAEPQWREFTDAWRASPPPSPITTALKVPYLYQNDSATGQGPRMCFSSTCAMAAMFLKPGCLDGPDQADDRYLRIVNRFGDSTDPAAQVAALQFLGIHAEFRQDGGIETITQQVAQGIPVPVGWLHRGPVSSPGGGGHWTLAIGWDPKAHQVVMNDPNGEADLVRGGYVSTSANSGRAVPYGAENWGRRWMAGPQGAYRFTPGTGWWLRLSR